MKTYCINADSLFFDTLLEKSLLLLSELQVRVDINLWMTFLGIWKVKYWPFSWDEPFWRYSHPFFSSLMTSKWLDFMVTWLKSCWISELPWYKRQGDGHIRSSKPQLCCFSTTFSNFSCMNTECCELWLFLKFWKHWVHFYFFYLTCEH